MKKHSTLKRPEQAVRTGYQRSEARPAESAPMVGRFEAAVLVSRWSSLVAVAVVVDRCADDWAEGFSASTGSPGGGRGSVSKPTEAAVIAADRPCGLCGGETPCRDHPRAGDGQVWAHAEGEGLAERAADAVARVEALAEQFSELWEILLQLAPLSPDLAHEIAVEHKTHKLGAGACGCCHEGVTGNGNDRLRAGFCSACYAAWTRSGKPDRALWVEVRRAMLVTRAGNTRGNAETAGALTENDIGVISEATGGGVRPGEGPYCEHAPPHLTDPDSFRCPVCAPNVEVA